MPRQSTSLKKSDLQEGKPVRVDVDGKPIVLAWVSGKIYAVDAVCSHVGGPLEEGDIEGFSLTRPWHGAIFDIMTGKVSKQTTWATNLNSYGVIVDNSSGQIFIDTNSHVTSLEMPMNNIATATPNTLAEEKATTRELTKPSKPLKMQLKLLEKTLHPGTDIMSFRFVLNDGQNYLD